MNENQISGKWNEFKGELRSMWGKLTDDEIEATKGDAQAIEGLIEQRYGDSKEDFRSRVNGLMDKYSIRRERSSEEVKDNLRH